MIQLLEGRHSLSDALRGYKNAWQKFIKEYRIQGWASEIRPTTISWKVADKAALYENLAELAAQTEQAHIGTVNDRFIASVVLRETAYDDMRVVKILERRAGANDPLGLDSIDYLVPSIDDALRTLKGVGAHVGKESNDMHTWLSLRFGEQLEFEAKLVDHPIITVAIKEMQAILPELS